MKAEELMIGDLVKFPHGIDKVCDLPYVEGKGICASFAASATLFPVPVEALEPIPLTSEILEKNGFRKLNNQYYLTLSKIYDTWEIIIDVYNGFYYLNVDQDRDDVDQGGIRDLKIFKVHELQHALRLCGIEKEIVL